MVELPDGIDARVAYLVMLNGKEQSPLHEALADIVQRKFLPEHEALPAAQRALQFLASGGWLTVTRSEQGGTHMVSASELESIIAVTGSWALPATSDAPFIGLEPTDLGVAAWRSGFPILGLSEAARAALMFPQARQ